MPDFEVIEACRGCGAGILEPVIAFGPMPLADGLLNNLEEADTEKRFPLTVVFCPACSLVQIRETVRPDLLFGEEYPYYSSFSEQLVEHSRLNVEALITRYQLDHQSRVIELASNDGYLLQWFVQAGIPVLGIDPAPGPAEAARQRGIPTRCEFFGRELAETLKAEDVLADVVIGNNVLAHVPDQNEFIAAIETILKPSGKVVMEFPYVKDLIDHGEFDTIYHEHHCYFSVGSVSRLFAGHGLHPVRVEHLPIHGGSLRVHFSRRSSPDSTVEEYLRDEAEAGMDEVAYYEAFAARAREIRAALVELLDELAGRGSSLAAYGAAAKGATLLNYCQIGVERLDYVVDLNTHKQGRYMPGVHLPIRSPDELRANPPDYLLLLAWNFRDEIVAQQRAYEEGGGRFIVPVPHPEVLEPSAKRS